MAFAAFGMGMLSKLATNLSDTYGSGEKLRETQRKENQADYLERERLGIVSRVEGAKAAGLHPLTALGYQGGNSPTSVIGSSEPPVVQMENRREERDPNIDRYNAARARLAEAEATKAERDLSASNRSLATQPGQPVGILPTSPNNLTRAGKVKRGVKVVPDEVVSGVGGITAATHPGISQVESPGVGLFRLPSTQASQQMEDMDILKYWLTYKANQDQIHRWFGDVYPPNMLSDKLFQFARDRDLKKRLGDWVNSKSRLSRPRLR